MKKRNEWTMRCPECNNKIKVTVEPLAETIICPVCGIKLKVIKNIQLITRPINPTQPEKVSYSYDLKIINE